MERNTGEKKRVHGRTDGGGHTTDEAQQREAGNRKKQVMKEVEEEDGTVSDEIEKETRIGRCVEGAKRPPKIRFRSQTAEEEVPTRAWKLARKEGVQACMNSVT